MVAVKIVVVFMDNFFEFSDQVKSKWELGARAYILRSEALWDIRN